MYQEKYKFNLLYDGRPLGQFYVGDGYYWFENGKQVWDINFDISIPHEILTLAKRVFLTNEEENNGRFIVNSIKDFNKTLQFRIFEPHDEYVSLANFPEKVYAQIQDPLLKKLVKEKIKEWSEGFPYPDRKSDFEKLLVKINKIDNITKS